MKAKVSYLAAVLVMASSSVFVQQANAKVVEPHSTKGACYQLPDLSSYLASATDALPLPSEVSDLLVDTASERLQQLQDTYWQHFTFSSQWGVYPPVFPSDDPNDPVNNHAYDPLYGSQYWDYSRGNYRFNVEYDYMTPYWQFRSHKVGIKPGPIYYDTMGRNFIIADVRQLNSSKKKVKVNHVGFGMGYGHDCNDLSNIELLTIAGSYKYKKKLKELTLNEIGISPSKQFKLTDFVMDLWPYNVQPWKSGHLYVKGDFSYKLFDLKDAYILFDWDDLSLRGKGDISFKVKTKKGKSYTLMSGFAQIATEIGYGDVLISQEIAAKGGLSGEVVDLMEDIEDITGVSLPTDLSLTTYAKADIYRYGGYDISASALAKDIYFELSHLDSSLVNLPTSNGLTLAQIQNNALKQLNRQLEVKTGKKIDSKIVQANGGIERLQLDLDFTNGVLNRIKLSISLGVESCIYVPWPIDSWECESLNFDDIEVELSV